MALGIALIGSGIFAKEEHLPAIQATPLLSLKAIYSRSLASAKSLSESLKDVELYSEDSGTGKTYSDLLKRDDIKGVIIALPILAQPAYIKAALSAGKHVLAEKPIGKDVADARALIQHHHSLLQQNPSLNFSIAENFRYLESFHYAAQQVASLGKVLGFRTRVSNYVKPGGKYFETAWRKTPGYQGGFLLDGGVHFVAGTRLLLGQASQPVKTSAYTTQLQPHLPPVDTLDATLKLANGSSGTISLSFGTTFTGSEYHIAAENGTVWVSRGTVKVTRDGKEEVKEFGDEGSGVTPEVKAWAEALERGSPDPRQSASEALDDLELLEAMLTSGDRNGEPVAVKIGQ